MIHQHSYIDGEVLPVIEEFYSIQGEGYHMGKPAYFIRIGGCDLACEWCDTRFAWDPADHPLTSVGSIIRNIINSGANTTVITGGEPLMYKLDYLCELIRKNNILTYLETSGAYPLSGKWDWICLSPKSQQPPVKKIYKHANELKIIVAKPSDLIWAEENEKFVNESCHKFLQPEWKAFNQVMSLIVDFVKSNQSWRISLQAHKFMHIP